MMTATGSATRFCWCSMFWSYVRTTSKPSPAARASKMPFLSPFHPMERHGVGVVPSQVLMKAHVQALIDQYLHAAGAAVVRTLSLASSSTASACSRVTGQEIIDRVTRFQHIKERAHRHARAGEARRATHDFGVAAD